MSSEIVLLARRSRPRWRTPLAALFVLATMLGGAVDAVAPAAATPLATGVTGQVFDDADRDGVRDDDEAGFADLSIYLLDADEQYLAAAGTTSAGHFDFGSVADGTYHVVVSSRSWRDLRDTWVRTDERLEVPGAYVSVAEGLAEPVDLGVRRLVWSTDIAAPLSEHVGASGLAARSYVDVIAAADVVEVLEASPMLGAEAADTTVFVGLTEGSHANTSVGGPTGAWTSFQGEIYFDYVSRVRSGHHVLFHEYGHIWGEYHDHLSQRDGAYAGYLDARGLSDDPRLETEKNWYPAEMIADDFRILYGVAGAETTVHMNHEIAQPQDVPGLASWFEDVFVVPVEGTSGTDETEPAPTEEPASGEEPEFALAISSLVAAASMTEVTVEGEVTRASTVDVVVVDERGKAVATLLVDAVADPAFAVVWDLSDDRGRRVKDGVYTVRAVASAGDETAHASTQVTVGSDDGTDAASPGKGNGPRK